MVVLDTDHMILLQRGSVEGLRIADRLRTLPPDDIATTIVSFPEDCGNRAGRERHSAYP